MGEINIASKSIIKGEVREGKQLIAWDALQDCRPEICPIGDTCEHYSPSSEKCAIQHQYLQKFVDMVFNTYKYVDEGDMYKIGMHLVPLYSQLCRQKIVEMSLKELTYIDNKGNPKIHPIYREIRETLKTISVIWKEIGFGAVIDPGNPSGASRKDGFGDPNHYKQISQMGDERRNVIR